MADLDQDHGHQHHRLHRHSIPARISIPPRSATLSGASPTPYTAPARAYHPLQPYAPSTPTPTPSKQRLASLSYKSSGGKSSLSFLFVLLFSLRSLYSLLPFLRSSPIFSLFPFSFLVSLLSFLLTLAFSSFSPSSGDPFHLHKQNQPVFSFDKITRSQHRLLLAKSLLLTVVFLLRFQALRYCGTAAMILAELSGNMAARFVAEGAADRNRNHSSKVRGLFVLITGLFFLSVSWDRIECFPFSTSYIEKWGFSVTPSGNCIRVWPMLLPFLCGFLGCYERVSMNWGSIRQLGQKKVRLISLFYTTVMLFVPAVVSFAMSEPYEDGVSIGNLGWPLANTVVFGVLLSETYSDEKHVGSKDFQKEFLVTFACTIVLELFYFPELSLWGLLLCGLLLYIAARELNPIYSSYLELGTESSESLTTAIMKPVRHILSERKSRKIALFLLINTGYMVVEFVAGFMSNSLGLISDACHMLFDCAALAIGLYASYISRLPANSQFNYGRGRFEVLSGYVNAVFLVLVGALIVLESFERILDPQEISTKSLLTVSVGGLLVNVVGLIFFHEEHHHAHGGSCSHSHSHSESHSHSHSHSSHQHSHDHDHESCNKPHECIAVSHELHGNSFSSHDDQADQHHCDDHEHDHHAHQHDHHAHQHDHHTHEHGHHAHQHDHHAHSHDHHDHHAHHGDHGDHNDHSHHDHHAHEHDHQAHGNLLHSPAVGPQSDGMGSQKKQHRHIDHNMEGIFLHVLADTLGSVGVVISTLLIKYKGWLVADPACSIFISVLIVSSVIPLLRNSAEVLLQRVPRAHEQDLKEAVNDVMKIRGVLGIQNLHVWSFTNTDVVGTVHLHVSAETDKASIKAQVSQMFRDAGVEDLTLQVECIKSLAGLSNSKYRASSGHKPTLLEARDASGRKDYELLANRRQQLLAGVGALCYGILKN